MTWQSHTNLYEIASLRSQRHHFCHPERSEGSKRKGSIGYEVASATKKRRRPTLKFVTERCTIR